MARSPRSTLFAALAATVVAVLAGAAVLLIASHRQASTATPNTSRLAIGEAVFQSGLGPDGRPIPRTVSQSGGGMMGGGGGMMGGGMMGGGMMRLGCAGCHGADGHGLETRQFTSPNITHANLTDPQGMLAPDGTRGPTYTDATLRRAVTIGVDPEGDHLAWPMPQWQLTDQEWSGLVAYLRTLH